MTTTSILPDNSPADIKKLFYRVNHETTMQGLWYDFSGGFTGLIHGDFSFCMNTQLRMDYDPEIVGFVSAVETLQQLYQWFNRNDILRLQELGWFIFEYQSDDYKWYERFSHYAVKQSSMTHACKIVLDPVAMPAPNMARPSA